MRSVPGAERGAMTGAGGGCASVQGERVGVCRWVGKWEWVMHAPLCSARAWIVHVVLPTSAGDARHRCAPSAACAVRHDTRVLRRGRRAFRVAHVWNAVLFSRSRPRSLSRRAPQPASRTAAPAASFRSECLSHRRMYWRRGGRGVCRRLPAGAPFWAQQARQGGREWARLCDHVPVLLIHSHVRVCSCAGDTKGRRRSPSLPPSLLLPLSLPVAGDGRGRAWRREAGRAGGRLCGRRSAGGWELQWNGAAVLHGGG